jgi:hypothetical protein
MSIARDEDAISRSFSDFSRFQNVLRARLATGEPRTLAILRAAHPFGHDVLGRAQLFSLVYPPALLHRHLDRSLDHSRPPQRGRHRAPERDNTTCDVMANNTICDVMRPMSHPWGRCKHEQHFAMRTATQRGEVTRSRIERRAMDGATGSA